MGTQITVKREDMEAAGWKHNSYEEVFYEWNDALEVEYEVVIKTCYFTHPDYHEDVKLWSYDENDLHCDYNSWRSDKPRLQFYGIHLLPHTIG